jgi:hypothetical protein
MGDMLLVFVLLGAPEDSREQILKAGEDLVKKASTRTRLRFTIERSTVSTRVARMVCSFLSKLWIDAGETSTIGGRIRDKRFP